jgi:hypothetical protein
MWILWQYSWAVRKRFGAAVVVAVAVVAVTVVAAIVVLDAIKFRGCLYYPDLSVCPAFQGSWTS